MGLFLIVCIFTSMQNIYFFRPPPLPQNVQLCIFGFQIQYNTWKLNFFFHKYAWLYDKWLLYLNIIVKL